MRLKYRNKSLEFEIQPNKKSDSIYYTYKVGFLLGILIIKQRRRVGPIKVSDICTLEIFLALTHIFKTKITYCQLGILVKPFWWWDNRLQRTETPAKSKKRRKKNHFRLQIQGDIFRSTLIQLYKVCSLDPKRPFHWVFRLRQANWAASKLFRYLFVVRNYVATYFSIFALYNLILFCIVFVLNGKSLSCLFN